MSLEPKTPLFQNHDFLAVDTRKVLLIFPVAPLDVDLLAPRGRR